MSLQKALILLAVVLAAVVAKTTLDSNRLAAIKSTIRDLEEHEIERREREEQESIESDDNENENENESNRKHKTIMVTGGGGFVGRRLARRLLGEGHRVISVDNFLSSIVEDSGSLALDFPETYSLIEHDISGSNEALLEALDDGVRLDQIYNLACPASPPIYQAYPIRTLQTNYLGVWNMLELARAHDAVLLQASTSEVYGEPQVHPQSEDYYGNVNVVGKRSCYDEGKRVAETILVEYHRKHGTDIRIVRIFNTFGPGMHPYDGRVVSNFIRQALDNQDITIYGSGEQTRSFQFIDDLVEGMARFMNADKSIGYGPLNFGNPDERTILELARVILDMVPSSKSKVIFKSKVSDDPSRRCPDISRAKEALGWQPKHTLEEGLRATISYFAHIDLSHYSKFPGSPSYELEQ
jgi:UDP-glucuronate decarboxylase